VQDGNDTDPEEYEDFVTYDFYTRRIQRKTVTDINPASATASASELKELYPDSKNDLSHSAGVYPGPARPRASSEASLPRYSSKLESKVGLKNGPGSEGSLNKNVPLVEERKFATNTTRIGDGAYSTRPGVNVMKLFYSSLRKRLQCLSFACLFSLVKYLRIKPEP